jgi:hypothetical protein
MTYASGTSVSVERSRMEIDSLLGKHGATSRGVATTEGMAQVAFVIGGLHYRLDVPLPAFKMTKQPPGWWGWNESRREEYKAKHTAQATRERWRAILLLLKAKLEAVRMGVSRVEKEFLSDLVLDGGGTVYQAMGERIAKALANGQPLALPAAGST